MLNNFIPGALLDAGKIEDFAFVVGDAFSDKVFMGALDFRLLGGVHRCYFGSREV